jgi:hypothetical protein
MNVRSRTRTAGPHLFAGSRPDLLAIYLNDHLTGATAGLERARHLQRTAQGSELGTALDPVVAEIAEDRESLLEIMRDLGVPVRRYRAGVGWAAEKAGRLKGNGRLLRRSPLSTVLELEALRLGVEGKAAGWQTSGACATPAGRHRGVAHPPRRPGPAAGIGQEWRQTGTHPGRGPFGCLRHTIGRVSRSAGSARVRLPPG